MTASLHDLVDRTCQVMQDSLALCPAELPGFRKLASTVIQAHTLRLIGQAGGPHPPWLSLPILTCEALTCEALTCDAFKCDSPDHDRRLTAAYHVAAAWELGNMAAAQLDAWQDQDTCGALWRKIGPGQTVNLSLGLIALSFRILSSLADDRLLPAPTALDLKREFEDTLLRMAAGQHADLGDDLELDDYQAVARAKTGSLFRLACWAGAVVAETPTSDAERYGAFGEALGLLIQTWNDLYGLEGAMGKQDTGHQRTLPILASMAMADGETAAGKARSPATKEQGGKLYALMQAGLLYQRAAAALAQCPAPGRLSRFLDSYSVGQMTGGGEGQDG